ncbi:hypothetical protein NN755_001592 [Salmonella enterica]|nr:hypothetical protein [Salmonella enterica]EHH9898319.1 hypothetical protein [Salmonella enterica]EHR6023163.1 hypothetical protein [Salmonella enterica]EIL7465194.1 hypothetical protein [Salmonella enterica]EIM6461482.1 hypothetical protein [Salmonella enterica]
MTSITREWLEKTIAEFENTRNDIPFGLDDDSAKILKVLKQALAYPETLPCPVHLLPGLCFGKGCKTEDLLIALQRRAEYYAELDAMTPEERMKYNDNIEAIRQLLPQPESPVTVLCLALERMLKMHELVMNKTNVGASFYDAECIREMNLAPIQAWQALTFARSKQ